MRKSDNNQTKKEITLIFEGIEMRAKPASTLGLAISYLRSSKTSAKQLVQELILMCYTPFVLNEDDPQYKEKVIKCICQLYSWIQLIENFTGIKVNSSNSQPSGFVAQNIEVKTETESEFEDYYDEEEEEDDDWDNSERNSISIV